jgi:hypothetical protein
MERNIEKHIADFESQLLAARQQGLTETSAYMSSLAADGKPGPAVLEFALRVMERFSETDNFLVAHYCRLIIERHGRAEQIGRVKEIRKKLPPLPGLRDYRPDYDGLLEILEARKNGICECLAKTRYNTSPSSDPLFKILSTEVDQEAYVTRYWTECKQCKTLYIVTEDPSYHYPIYNWVSQ